MDSSAAKSKDLNKLDVKLRYARRHERIFSISEICSKTAKLDLNDMRCAAKYTIVLSPIGADNLQNVAASRNYI